MTVAAVSVPTSASRLRIAITSPDILARIRQVFASKNLDVEIIRLPYVEVTIRRSASGAPADGSVLVGLAAGATAPRRLCAEYRLNVVEVDAGPPVEHPAPTRRRHLAAVPDPDAPDPEVALSRRQGEVMALVSRGVRNAEIAARLRVSEKTVKNHINRIFRSLGAGNRVEAVLIWQRHQRHATAPRAARIPAPTAGPARTETP